MLFCRVGVVEVAAAVAVTVAVVVIRIGGFQDIL
jgi:hypothetical protein